MLVDKIHRDTFQQHHMLVVSRERKPCVPKTYLCPLNVVPLCSCCGFAVWLGYSLQSPKKELHLKIQVRPSQSCSRFRPAIRLSRRFWKSHEPLEPREGEPSLPKKP